MVGLITGASEGQGPRHLVVGGTLSRRVQVPQEKICVVTRRGVDTQAQADSEGSDEEEPEIRGNERPEDEQAEEEVSSDEDIVELEDNQEEGTPEEEGSPGEESQEAPRKVQERAPDEEGEWGTGQSMSPLMNLDPQVPPAHPTNGSGWGDDYAQSAFWSAAWNQTQVPQRQWLECIRLQGDKMLWEGKIWVPEKSGE